MNLKLQNAKQEYQPLYQRVQLSGQIRWVCEKEETDLNATVGMVLVDLHATVGVALVWKSKKW
jgi:hypothetical protein